MDIMTLLAQIPGIGPVLPYIVALGAICAALSTVLPPPKGSGVYATVYRAINLIGLNIGHASNANAPSSSKPPAGTASVIVAMIAFGVLAGCTTPQMQQASQDASIVATAGAQIAVSDASKPDLVTLQKQCDAFNAVVVTSAVVTNGGAKTTAGYVAAPGQSFCEIVKKGAVPANADSNSMNWLNVLATTIETVKALAPLAVALL